MRECWALFVNVINWRKDVATYETLKNELEQIKSQIDKVSNFEDAEKVIEKLDANFDELKKLTGNYSNILDFFRDNLKARNEAANKYLEFRYKTK